MHVCTYARIHVYTYTRCYIKCLCIWNTKYGSIGQSLLRIFISHTLRTHFLYHIVHIHSSTFEKSMLQIKHTLHITYSTYISYSIFHIEKCLILRGINRIYFVIPYISYYIPITYYISHVAHITSILHISYSMFHIRCDIHQTRHTPAAARNYRALHSVFHPLQITYFYVLHMKSCIY
jgi:hypothetical protein